jgi:predicted nucleic acid-binding Zn ribbon protein
VPTASVTATMKKNRKDKRNLEIFVCSVTHVTFVNGRLATNVQQDFSPAKIPRSDILEYQNDRNGVNTFQNFLIISLLFLKYVLC